MDASWPAVAPVTFQSKPRFGAWPNAPNPRVDVYKRQQHERSVERGSRHIGGAARQVNAVDDSGWKRHLIPGLLVRMVAQLSLIHI